VGAQYWDKPRGERGAPLRGGRDFFGETNHRVVGGGGDFLSAIPLEKGPPPSPPAISHTRLYRTQALDAKRLGAHLAERRLNFAGDLGIGARRRQFAF